ncbi:hypothetical protein O9G_000868 [Rozella allomycis CSF55]|uniref:FYVE-type domain-containing protein n=1 Tax=Rozella allomycis (strain CSF55) TaxID=988480 RepID=A0A075ARC6_ROZAC|nr:hypothetical protein O9G_000868 [Rozella allomycis CSF55]|eukprot:EPZ32793.1 hypothetical protein O9G_000868 [Rozella allomycis CSF55]
MKEICSVDISKVFYEFKEGFEMYIEYARGFKGAIDLLASFNNRDHKSIQKSTVPKLDIIGILNNAHTAITKSTDSESLRNYTIEAHNLIKQLNIYVNDGLKESDMLIEMIKLEKSLSGFNESITFSSLTIASYMRGNAYDFEKFEIDDCIISDVPNSSGYSFKIMTPYKSFIVSAESAAIKEKWALNFRKIEKNRHITKLAPIWMADSTTDKCVLCNKTFTLIWRRHHCRFCGHLICSTCSSNKIPVLADKEKTAVHRICIKCWENSIN